MTYTGFDISEVHGDLLADYVVGIEADFQITHDGDVVFDEPSFPVVELARDLAEWLQGKPLGDFVFESMSADVPDLISIQQRDAGWVIYSGWTPDVVSKATDVEDIVLAAREFIHTVRNDIKGRGLDASWILDPRAKS